MVAVALVKQGRPSVERCGASGYRCLYRGPEGTRCAAGHLFEGVLGEDFAEGGSCLEDKIASLLRAAGHDPDFAGHLQRVHDGCAGSADWLREWATEMRNAACTYNLSTAALDAALAARQAPNV